MKRALAGATALAMGLTLAACGGGSNQSQQNQTPAESPASPSVTRPSMPSTMPSIPSSMAHPELWTRLVPGPDYPNARGGSGYEADHGHRTLHVRVMQVQALSGKTLTVTVGATKVGTMKVSGNGVALAEFETQHGDKVPVVKTGGGVKVTDANGVTVVTGVYAAVPHMQHD